jgi:hypothetical protein
MIGFMGAPFPEECGRRWIGVTTALAILSPTLF